MFAVSQFETGSTKHGARTWATWLAIGHHESEVVCQWHQRL